MARRNTRFEHNGYNLRSKLEVQVAEGLDQKGIEYSYERESIPYKDYIPRSYCEECESRLCYVSRKYTPDFFLSNGIILEVKGRFTAKDRRIIMAMKEQWPELDIRMVFQTNNKLNRGRGTRYSDWCEKKKIPYTIGPLLPEEWLT